MPRYAQLLVAGELLDGILKDGTAHSVPVAHHLPADARCVGAYTAHPGTVGLIFESETFPEAGHGSDAAMLPVLKSIHLRGTTPAILAIPSVN